MSKKKWLTMAAVLVLLAIGLVGLKKFREWRKAKQEWFNSSEPALLFVFFKDYPQIDGGSTVPQMKLLSKVDLLKTCREHHIWSIEGIADKDGTMINYVLVKTRAEGGKEYFRLRVIENGILQEFDELAYSGEDYVPLCHGDKWYLSIVRLSKIEGLRRLQ